MQQLFRGFVFLLLALMLAIQSTNCQDQKIAILDKEPALNIKQLAETVCETSKGNGRQISRISTIEKLDKFFLDQLANESKETLGKLADCYLNFIGPLRELKVLLKASLKNVCSDEKVSLIEDFHHQYISNNDDSLPQILRLFFIHYAMEVSATCKKGVINNLEWDVASKFSEEDYQFGDNHLLDKLMQSLANIKGSVHNYEDVILLWDLVPNSLFGNKPPQEASQAGLQEVKALVKVRDADKLRSIQGHCRNKFRPIYSKLIMPIIRLANLGYSVDGERFANELKELRDNTEVARWYSLTQICEALLPMKFYTDQSLGSQETVLISEDEAVALEEAEGNRPAVEEKAVEYEPSTNTFEGLDEIFSVHSEEAQSVLSRLQLNVNAREKGLKLTLLRMGGAIKAYIKSRAKQLFFSTSNSGTGAFEKKDMREVLSKSVGEMDEKQLLEMGGSVSRKKRRPRKYDMEQHEKVLYIRTKPWSQIFQEWGDNLKMLIPSRKVILLIGIVGISVILLCIVSAIFSITLALG